MDTLLWTLMLCCAAVATVNASCGETQYQCQTNHGGSCLPLRWVCDGDNDCFDHSDERECGSRRTCPDGFFACDSGRCIPSQWKCDGENDCRDHGSDEQHCAAQRHCTVDEFACQSQRLPRGCIPLWWVCDGDFRDCVDGSDERHCETPRTCPEGHFSCDSGQCIPNSWVCDGSNDCHNSDLDERNCHTTDATPPPQRILVPQATCSEGQFSCASRRWGGGCVPLQTVCDARAGDCDDGSDEAHCEAARTCPPRWMACASGRCVPPAMVCDGRVQCPDGADESQCGGRGESGATAQGGALRLELPRGLDQDAHFALSLAPMLRARAPRDKLDAQMAVLRLFRDLARN